MANFCPKCGKKLKTGAKFCPSCGAKMKARPSPALAPAPAPVPSAVVPQPVPAPAPVAAPKKSRAGLGCAIGCLIVVIIILLILGGLIGAGYYFLFVRDKGGGKYFPINPEDKAKIERPVECGPSFSCLDENLKKCESAQGETEMEDFAVVGFKVVGSSNSSCVVYVEVTEIKNIPQLEEVPSFVRKRILKNLSGECLIPQKIYTLGIEKTSEYIGENMFDICEGTLLNLLKKYSPRDSN